MAEIIWTAEAETWLKDIYDYILKAVRKRLQRLFKEYTGGFSNWQRSRNQGICTGQRQVEILKSFFTGIIVSPINCNSTTE